MYMYSCICLCLCFRIYICVNSDKAPTNKICRRAPLMLKIRMYVKASLIIFNRGGGDGSSINRGGARRQSSW